MIFSLSGDCKAIVSFNCDFLSLRVILPGLRWCLLRIRRHMNLNRNFKRSYSLVLINDVMVSTKMISREEFRRTEPPCTEHMRDVTLSSFSSFLVRLYRFIVTVHFLLRRVFFRRPSQWYCRCFVFHCVLSFHLIQLTELGLGSKERFWQVLLSLLTF